MAFEIVCRDHEVDAILGQLDHYLAESRFTLRDRNVRRGRGDVRRISLHDVRLRESKPYCGNHPGPCLVGGAHRHGRWLEGLDWVSWNDLLNDLLDGLRHSGSAASTHVQLRRDGCRRIHYDMRDQTAENRNGVRPHWEWVRHGEPDDYLDCRGQPAPLSQYPASTPGILGWRRT